MAIEKMQIAVTPANHDGLKIMTLTGALNIHTIFDFQNAVRAESAPGIVIDLNAVPFVDSAGLGAIVGAVVNMQKAGRKVAFTGMNTKVAALVDMSHLHKVVRNFATVQDAESAVA
jgi:anti-anti-sigma factor